MRKFEYRPNDYGFAKIIADFFRVSSLEKLHLERKDLMPPKELNYENETKTKFHESFYGEFHKGWPDLEEAYFSFIKNEIPKVYKGDFIFQSFPSIRFHLPQDKAIHKWHYDSDEDHNHPDWEINFHLALTDISKTQSVWVESVPGLQDFRPMEMKYGEYYVFNGNKCQHGNKVNLTNSTRVSFDFRIMPMEKYKKIDDSLVKNSLTSKKKFKIGSYYSSLKGA